MPKNQSVLDGFQAIEKIAENLNTKLKDLKGATALKIVREEGFKSFSIEKIAQANFTLLDKALDEVISQLFKEFPELLYVTCGVCTEEYNDQNDPGFNTLVFGFVPEYLREISVSAIRNYKENRKNELSARERLFLESQDIIFPVMESSNFWPEDDEVETRTLPEQFEERAMEVSRIARQWFVVYEENGNMDTDERFRYWRDAHFSRHSGGASWD